MTAQQRWPTSNEPSGHAAISPQSSSPRTRGLTGQRGMRERVSPAHALGKPSPRMELGAIETKRANADQRLARLGRGQRPLDDAEGRRRPRPIEHGRAIRGRQRHGSRRIRRSQQQWGRPGDFPSESVESRLVAASSRAPASSAASTVSTRSTRQARQAALGLARSLAALAVTSLVGRLGSRE